MEFGWLLTSLDLSEEDIAEAANSCESMSGLLARFEEIAGPGEGAAILLCALARLATTAACGWLEGELRIEIHGDASTKITIATTIGGGFREKVFPDTNLRVPFEEFARAIELDPKLVDPLLVRKGERRIVLYASSVVRNTSLPPPMIKVDPTCLMSRARLADPRTARARGGDRPNASKARRADTTVGLGPDPNRPATPVTDPKLVLVRRIRSNRAT